MVDTLIKQIKHSVLCVSGVYLRDITDMIFVILHLNVGHLSVCSSCLIKFLFSVLLFNINFFFLFKQLTVFQGLCFLSFFTTFQHLTYCPFPVC